MVKAFLRQTLDDPLGFGLRFTSVLHLSFSFAPHRPAAGAPAIRSSRDPFWPCGRRTAPCEGTAAHAMKGLQGTVKGLQGQEGEGCFMFFVFLFHAILGPED